MGKSKGLFELRPWPRLLNSVGLAMIAFFVSSCYSDNVPKNQPPIVEANRLRFSAIAVAYHGMLLDQELKEIKLDRRGLEAMQDSIFQSLIAERRLDPKDFKFPIPNLSEIQSPLSKEAVYAFTERADFSTDERLLAKLAFIQAGIDAAPSQERVELQWRFDVLNERLVGELNLGPEPGARLRRGFTEALPPEIQQRLIALMAKWFRTTEYMAECRRNSVPLPPDWPTGSGWVNRGTLPFKFNFLSSGPDTEVWVHETAGGLCYALPRKNGAVVNLLGIICQSKSTGKACFWDNIDAATSRRISGEGITLAINRLKDGSNLAENCTNCHRGANAFIVHPETPLGSPSERDPLVRYSPIGQVGWTNPPPLSAQGSGACSNCHEIGGASVGFCAILRQAAELTMPNATRPAGWGMPRSPYDAHILTLKVSCP